MIQVTPAGRVAAWALGGWMAGSGIGWAATTLPQPWAGVAVAVGGILVVAATGRIVVLGRRVRRLRAELADLERQLIEHLGRNGNGR